MADIKFTNFAFSQLAVGITAGDVTIAVVGGHGARFPTLGAGEYFYATLEDALLNREIVKVTARVTDTFTVVRAQDNTSARAWTAGDSVALRFNAAAIEDYLSGPSTVTANSTSDALRITQTGTGNALVVEDSTSPDGTPFVIDQSGNLVNGHTTALALNGSGGTPINQAHGAGSFFANAAWASMQWGNNTTAGGVFIGKARGVTPGTYTIVQSGDNLGEIRFAGADGVQTQQAANIRAQVDGAPGLGDMPGRLVFSTTPDGSGTPVERMRITSTGTVQITQTDTSNTLYLTNPTQVSTGDFGTNLGTGGTVSLVSTGGTQGEGQLGVGIAFSGINTSRRRALIAAVQDTSNANQVGLSFYTRTSTTTASDTLNANPALRLTHNNGVVIDKVAVTAPAASDGNVFSGTYTPTLTNVTNIDSSTARVCNYMRVGNVVTVSGRVTVDPTTSGSNFNLRMSLPVASNFAAAENGVGTFRSGTTTHINAGVIFAASATDDVSFNIVAEVTANSEYYFHFTYRVI
jgi:hypothetical protein